MARTYTLASGVASGYRIWPPSGGVWTFQASSATNAGPEYSTDNPLDIRELDKDYRLEGDGSPGTFEPPETPQVVRVRKSTGELFDEDGDTLPVVNAAELSPYSATDISSGETYDLGRLGSFSVDASGQVYAHPDNDGGAETAIPSIDPADGSVYVTPIGALA